MDMHCHLHYVSIAWYPHTIVLIRGEVDIHPPQVGNDPPIDAYGSIWVLLFNRRSRSGFYESVISDAICGAYEHVLRVHVFP